MLNRSDQIITKIGMIHKIYQADETPIINLGGPSHMAVSCVQDGAGGISQAACIETKRIYDSFRDKDCLQNYRVYFNCDCQEMINNSSSVKGKSASVLWVYTDVDELSYNTGYYAVTLKYYIQVTVEVTMPNKSCCETTGLVVFEKKAVLYGSQGGALSFCSGYEPTEADINNCRFSKNNLPEVCVDVVDPVILDIKLVDSCARRGCGCGCRCECECDCADQSDMPSVPDVISGCISICDIDPDPAKRVYVSLGLFTIARMSRRTQLLIPVYDLCIPQKESENVSGSTASPCDIFGQYAFPTDEFYPPALDR